MKRVDFHTKPNIAEALSASFGLHITLQLDWKRIELEIDCLHLFNSLKNNIINHHEEGVLIEDIQWQRKHLKDCFWRHTKREGNGVTHAMASINPGPDTPIRVWLTNYPTLIENLALCDCRSIGC